MLRRFLPIALGLALLVGLATAAVAAGPFGPHRPAAPPGQDRVGLCIPTHDTELPFVFIVVPKVAAVAIEAAIGAFPVPSAADCVGLPAATPPATVPATVPATAPATAPVSLPAATPV